MKNAALFLLALSLGGTVSAQRSAIQSASNYLNDKDYQHAIEYIDKASADGSTVNDPKTWYVRGLIYTTMQDDSKVNSSDPYKEAAKSYLKVVSIKPDYQKEDVDNGLVKCLFTYYNAGVRAYNAGKYDDSYSLMMDADKITSLDGGKRFSKYKYAPTVDTLAAEVKNIAGLSAYQLKNYDEALTIFKSIKNNPIAKRPKLYSDIADIYLKQHKDAEFVTAIEEAKAAYPNDQIINVQELNYYISSGKQGELVKKLEENVTKYPSNPLLLFTLANTYGKMAASTEGAAKQEWLKKAEDSYQKTIQLAPDTALYNYNAGVLFYDQAVDINTQMNAISGNTAADNKKFDDLKKQRDAMFVKALPYFEKAYSVLSARASLSGDDRNTLHDTMIALREVYAKTDKLDKATEMKKKIEAMN